MNAFQHAAHDYLVLFAMVNAFGNLPSLWELMHGMDRAAKAVAVVIGGIRGSF